MELYIVLAIMAFMIVGFLLNKWPFGLTTMTCCVLLALTGVFTIPEAFAGFCNKTLILLVAAAIYILASPRMTDEDRHHRLSANGYSPVAEASASTMDSSGQPPGRCSPQRS